MTTATDAPHPGAIPAGYTSTDPAQLGFFDDGVFLSRPASAPQVTGAAPPARVKHRRMRIGRFDWPVLLWVCRHRVVLSHQVLYRFWWLDARSPAHGVRVIRSLVRRGYLVAEPLDRREGRASRAVLRPSLLGWRMVQGTPGGRELRERQQHVGLHWTHTALLLESKGWRELRTPDERWAAVRAWGLAQYRRPGLTEYDKQDREMLWRMRSVVFPRFLQIWGHAATGQIRFVMEAVDRSVIARRLNTIPDLRAFPPLPITIIGSNGGDFHTAPAAVAKWARQRKNRKRFRYELVDIEHYFVRQSPLRRPLPKVSRYTEHNVPSPLDLRKPTDA